MSASVPTILQRRHGLRGALLKRLPHVWYEPPQTAEIAIPCLSQPSVSAFECHLQMTVAQNAFAEIVAPEVAFSVSICAVRIVDFHVKIFGIRYRSHKSPNEELVEPEPIIASGAVVGKSPIRPTRHPYAHLYGLLYPPFEDVAAEQIPKFNELRDYQRVGVEFLVNREHALLADDMGLGKTAQCSIAIAILRRCERIGRTLIICPRSLIRQWEKEAKDWAGLHITTIDGTPVMRKRLWESFPGVLMATPNIVLNDAEVLSKCHFDLVVCDDISMLKNPGKITTAIRNLPRKRSWCLSGTPLENKPEDFTNVMQFVYPGLFSAADRGNAPSSTKIQQKIKPYFLRRRKTDCLKELPPKQSIGPIELALEGAQLQAYRHAEQQKWKELQEAGIKLNKLHVFSLINALLQICNAIHQPTRQSAKAEAMREHLEVALDAERTDVKAIVFSRWVETLRFLEREFSGFRPQLYHGGLSDRERQAVLNDFRTKGRLLLMSTKAGSRGLNLQEASYVFHFDRGWNPVDEMQAEDRCWRMGQKESVSVYRYMLLGTIEERINQVLKHKRGQFDMYVDSMAEDTDTLAATQWSLDELIDLLRPTSK